MLLILCVLSLCSILPSVAVLDSQNIERSENAKISTSSCRVCVGLGRNCAANQTQQECEFCSKVVGRLKNPEHVPDWVKNYLNRAHENNKIEGMHGHVSL